MGRHTEERAEALATGRWYYHGRRCPKCLTRFHYTTDKSCICCGQMRTEADLTQRQRAAIKGELLYEGAPCGNCGGRMRYVSNCTCRDCTVQVRATPEQQAHQSARRANTLRLQLYGTI